MLKIIFGRDVFAAYRNLPAWGWGIVVKIERQEALQESFFLASVLGILGLAFTIGAGLISYLLASHLTKPIVKLTKKVTKLQPGHWGFRSTIRTGDEIEVLDRVASDLAARLKKSYEHLEDLVEERTAELRKQYAKDRTILENIDHGVLFVDKKGVIIDANPAVLRLLNLKSQQVIGQKSSDALLFCKHAKELEKKKNLIMDALKSKKKFHANTKRSHQYPPIRLIRLSL